MAQTDAFLEELVRVSADLDRLIADRQVGRPSQLRHDGHVDRAEKLADRLRGIGRGSGRPQHPPLAATATGYVW